MPFVLSAIARRATAEDSGTEAKNGGGGGIRTHGTFRLSSFQDWRNRPLYHPSVRENQASRGSRYAPDVAGDQGNFYD